MVNENTLSQEESINYMEEKFEVPFVRTSFESVEWYTITWSVKKEYRDRAEDYISQEKTLEKSGWSTGYGKSGAYVFAL